MMQNNLTTTCKRHPLVSPQFADEDDDDKGTRNAACAWIQPNGVYTYTHSMAKALGTSLQQHGYSAEKQNPRNKSGTSTLPRDGPMDFEGRRRMTRLRRQLTPIGSSLTTRNHLPWYPWVPSTLSWSSRHQQKTALSVDTMLESWAWRCTACPCLACF